MKKYVEVYPLMEFANNMKDKSIDANDIARFPWADVRENIHAHWILDDPKRLFGHCSNCGCCGIAYDRFLFCPNCGAQMDVVVAKNATTTNEEDPFVMRLDAVARRVVDDVIGEK